MRYITRINLKTDTDDREGLMEFCLGDPDYQMLAIGWSCVYGDYMSYQEYYDAVMAWNELNGYRRNSVHNIFLDVKDNDLFWTRDLDGSYWICRAKSKALAYCDEELDIGAVIPVEAYNFGLDVPGRIKASFNRPFGGIAEKIYADKDKAIIEFSKKVFNDYSGRKIYNIENYGEDDLLRNLPDFELEELVISYIQIKYNYYVLSNSIANKSTTIKIECAFMSRDKNNPCKAVVQVKGAGRDEPLLATEFKGFLDKGYKVFLFANSYCNDEGLENVICISKNDLLDFYNEYKAILPESITRWESLM